MRREAGLPQPWVRDLGPGGAGNAGAARWLPQVMFRINRALRGVQHEVVGPSLNHPAVDLQLGLCTLEEFLTIIYG
jgi:hypothetical protein